MLDSMPVATAERAESSLLPSGVPGLSPVAARMASEFEVTSLVWLGAGFILIFLRLFVCSDEPI
ncbi:MAG TPA: hypothetical protein PKD95_03130 [Candidatus Paceibacterota bacterium]|nr:hypothetical protein [Candidatus Paceibacterota bacterium]